MDWPSNWVDSMNSRRRLAGDQPFIEAGIESEGVFTPLGPDALIIMKLDPNDLQIALNLPNPETMGLGSQFDPDNVII
jgi:hypothetical protein